MQQRLTQQDVSACCEHVRPTQTQSLVVSTFDRKAGTDEAGPLLQHATAHSHANKGKVAIFSLLCPQGESPGKVVSIKVTDPLPFDQLIFKTLLLILVFFAPNAEKFLKGET